MFLTMINVHSKWIEAMVTPTTLLHVVIEELRTVFVKFGLLCNRHGTGFTSQEFETFLKKNTTSAPYHPASSGLAERVVQIMKKGLVTNDT